MHTDKSNSLSEARNTLNQINREIPSYPIGSTTREALEQTAIVLESLIWQLVHEDLKLITESLKDHQLKLRELTKEINSKNASLTKITSMVEKISQMIGSLASLAVLVVGILFYY